MSKLSKQIENLQISWDAHSLKEYQHCPRRYQYTILQGWTGRTQATDLEFGIKYHDCLELYARLKVQQLDIQEIKRRVLTLALKKMHEFETPSNLKNGFTLVRSIMWYIDYWEENSHTKILEEIDGVPSIEQHFRVPLPDFSGAHEEYELVGYMDGVGEDPRGDLYVIEHKTTGKTISSALVDSYRIDTQIDMYSFVGSFIFARPIEGIMMDFTQVAVGFTRFMRAPIEKTKDYLQEFGRDLIEWIKLAQDSAMNNYWPKNGRNCWGCGFKHVCAAPKEARPLILKGDFDKRIWDPTEARNHVEE